MVRQTVARFLAQSSGEVDFGLDQALIPIRLWDRGGDNQFNINGVLTLGGAPVAGARVGMNAYTLPTPTGDDGSFTLRGDRTVLSRLRLHVADASEATVGGATATAADAEALLAGESIIETAFAINLTARQTAAAGATISAQVTFDDGTTAVPSVALWGYQLTGTVLDESGAPITGAHVSISDDEGETWAVSGQTEADGAYALRFFPVGEAEFSVRISLGSDLYESATPVTFDPSTSARLDVMATTSMGMPMTVGTGADGAFDVEDVPGAEYVGYLAGIAVDDVPVTGQTTWPDASGTFSVTLPDPLPTGELSFFQARLRFISADEISPGLPVPTGVIPATLDATAPRNLPPVLGG